MKIGIINYHCAHNYGAMLQAYAIQETLSEQGHEAVTIDFEPPCIVDGYKIWGKKWWLRPKYVFNTLTHYKEKKYKYDIFEKFKNEFLNLTQEIYTNINADTLNGFNGFICGSDQVWNMNINGGFSEYFLSFVTDKNIKKVAYAASIGTKNIDSEYIKFFKQELSSFYAISVREDDAAKEIQDKLKLDAIQVLDPVFLISKTKWEEISLVPFKIDFEYVLLYGLESNQNFEDTLSFIKENYNYKIINISPIKNISNNIDISLDSVGPREFIGLLKNAKIVFTNSFHGTCFSIIFGKNFLTLGHSELNSRIESILRLTQLSSHLINVAFTSKEEFEEKIKIDKEKLDPILKIQIEKSKQFLLDIFK